MSESLSPPGSDIGTVLAEAGATGLEQSAGIVHEEFHKQLQGARGVRVYKQMRDNEPIIGAWMYAAELLIRSTSWVIEPKTQSPTPQQLEIATLAEQCRTDMLSTWGEVISEALSAMTFGFSLIEKTYKVRGGDSESALFRSQYSDGRIGWKDLPLRAQETVSRWIFDKSSGRVTGLEQRAAPSYRATLIPMTKLLHFRIRSHKGNPEGRSLLRNAYRPWFYATRLQEIEAIGIERNTAGLPVITLPVRFFTSGATADERAVLEEAKQTARRLRMDSMAGLVTPAPEERGEKTGYGVSLMSSSGRSFADTDPIIRRYESRAAIATLGEFVLLGMDKVGSFALSSNKSEFFALALSAIADDLCDLFNRDALPELARLNGFAPEDAPILKHGDIRQPDVEKLMQFVVQGVQGGVITPDEKLEQFVRDYGSLPAKEGVGAALAAAAAAGRYPAGSDSPETT
jgi:hypothetical protein